MIYVLWAVLLLIQNASFTTVSRARNSGSDWYHGIAAIFSNGIWFISQFILIDIVWTTIQEGTIWPTGAMLGVLYVVCTVTGSVAAGKFLRRYVEKGKRRVGAY